MSDQSHSEHTALIDIAAEASYFLQEQMSGSEQMESTRTLRAAIARAHVTLGHYGKNPTTEPASPIKPQQLNAALKLAGWKHTHHSPDRYDSWQVPLSTREEADLIVPLDSSAGDYVELLDYAITKLKFLEQRGASAQQALRHLKNQASSLPPALKSVFSSPEHRCG